MNSVCLITSTHISYNPRIVKEADALTAAGFDVRVVAINQEPAKAEFDAKLLTSRSWRCKTVNARRDSMIGWVRWMFATLRQSLFRQCWISSHHDSLVFRAYSRFYPELLAIAVERHADLYLAHNLGALPVAMAAGRKRNSLIGFDAEDFHRGEFHDNEAVKVAKELTESVEEACLPQCNHLTAASDGIAEAYAETFQVIRPKTILNVFPIAGSRGTVSKQELEKERLGGEISLYWFSQVIGPDRGLNDVLMALSELPDRVHLHVRGSWQEGGENFFQSKVASMHLKARVHCLPITPPSELIERASVHDIGLALEPGDRLNNAIAASNKLFVYFQAGLAIAATDVPGQSRILAQQPESGFLYRPGNSKALASGLRRWLDDSDELKLAKRSAREAAEMKFCWEVESLKLIEAVKAALVGRTG